MRTAIRKAGVACGTIFASSALAVTTATGAWGSNSALVIAGLETSSLHDTVMSQLLGGALQGQQRVSVNWPAEAAPFTGAGDLTLGDSIEVGKANLSSEIAAALSRLAAPGEKVTVVGLSAGSLVVNEVLRDLDTDANAPAADQITFVVVADSSRQQVINTEKPNSDFDYTYRPAPETKYDVSVVVAEFDGTHDFPDRWWHFTAVINSIAGTIVSHIPVMFEDLSEVPATNIDVDVNNEGGTTTTYLVPSGELPLVTLLPFLKPLEASLRASVEKGYSRYDNKAFAVQAAAVAAPAVVEEAEDTVTLAAESKVTEVEAASEVEAATDAGDAKDDEVADVDSPAVSAEAADVDSDSAAVEAAESEAAESEAAEAEAAEVESVEAEAAESEAAESEAADAEADTDDDADASVSESSDDSSSSDSGSSDSSDSE